MKTHSGLCLGMGAKNATDLWNELKMRRLEECVMFR
jgi:hypothetical protein